jgi:integrase
MGDWYSARLLIERTIETPKASKPLFEESVIIFKMGNDATPGAVRKRVNQLGRKASHRYKNPYGETVRWTFREVLEVQEIMGEELADGTEVYYRWWDNPSDRKLRMIRETHEEPWWT